MTAEIRQLVADALASLTVTDRARLNYAVTIIVLARTPAGTTVASAAVLSWSAARAIPALSGLRAGDNLVVLDRRGLLPQVHVSNAHTLAGVVSWGLA